LRAARLSLQACSGILNSFGLRSLGLSRHEQDLRIAVQRNCTLQSLDTFGPWVEMAALSVSCSQPPTSTTPHIQPTRSRLCAGHSVLHSPSYHMRPHIILLAANACSLIAPPCRLCCPGCIDNAPWYASSLSSHQDCPVLYAQRRLA
jgi:hypothetical protein